MGGVGSGHLTHGCGSAGPEGQWAWREGQVSWQAVGLEQTGGWDPGDRGSGGMAKGWVF
jgi:hypothetical protein